PSSGSSSRSPAHERRDCARHPLGRPGGRACGRGFRRSHSATRSAALPRSREWCALTAGAPTTQPRSRRPQTSRFQVRTQLTRLRAALVVLLVGSGLLFAIGSTIERHQHHSENPAATKSAGESSGESGGETGSRESTKHVEKSHGETGATI